MPSSLVPRFALASCFHGAANALPFLLTNQDKILLSLLTIRRSIWTSYAPSLQWWWKRHTCKRAVSRSKNWGAFFFFWCLASLNLFLATQSSYPSLSQKKLPLPCTFSWQIFNSHQFQQCLLQSWPRRNLWWYYKALPVLRTHDSVGNLVTFISKEGVEYNLCKLKTNSNTRDVSE